jgi:phosphoglycerate dehydrogenase-like enzyme
MDVLFNGQPDSWGGVYHQIVAKLRPSSDIQIRCIGTEEPDDGEVEALISTSEKIDKETIQRMPNLRLIQQAGAGIDGIDLVTAAARNIAVANVPTDVSGAARAVAEHALGMMIALGRRHRDYPKTIQDGLLGMPVGSTLFKKTVGIIGFGAIGRHLANLLEPFEVSVIAISNTGSRHPTQKHVHWVRRQDDLPHLLRQSDFVVLACPLNKSTYRIINRDALSHCKPGVYIINVARGALLDPGALLEGLSDGRVSGLGIDVFDKEPTDSADPLVLHSNTVASPHVASSTSDVIEATASIVAENIERSLRNQPPLFEVTP